MLLLQQRSHSTEGNPTVLPGLGFASTAARPSSSLYASLTSYTLSGNFPEWFETALTHDCSRADSGMIGCRTPNQSSVRSASSVSVSAGIFSKLTALVINRMIFE